MNKAAIAFQNLTKTFSVGKVLRRLVKAPPRERGTEVLKGISLEVYEGEVLGLLGPHGMGKTTLLEILELLPQIGILRSFALAGLPLSLLAFHWGVRWAKVTGTLSHF